MNPIDDGGPAFPCPEDYTQEGVAIYGPKNLQGMSLRDYFAAAALQGLLANPGGPIQANGMAGWGWADCDQKNVVEAAFGIADDMLAARKEGA